MPRSPGGPKKVASACATLSMHQEYSRSFYPDVEPQPPTDFDAALKARKPQSSPPISPRGSWLNRVESEAESFSDQDLDDLIAFYNLTRRPGDDQSPAASSQKPLSLPFSPAE